MNRTTSSAAAATSLVLMIISHLSTATTAVVEPVIFGGKQAPEHAYRFMAHVRSGEEGYLGKGSQCGATLIAPRFLLTAAHCHTSESPITHVVIGSRYHEPTMIRGDVRPVSRVTMHPQYDSVNLENDYAIIELEEEIYNIKPVLLSGRKEEEYGEMATALGWGSYDASFTMSSVLKEQEFELISPDVCLAKMKSATRRAKFDSLQVQVVGETADSQVCVLSTPTTGDSVCFGDSGGPLIKSKDDYQPLLIGVASALIQCGLDDAPAVFARVSYARDFIDQNSRGHEWVEFHDTGCTAPRSSAIQTLVLMAFGGLLAFNT